MRVLHAVHPIFATRLRDLGAEDDDEHPGEPESGKAIDHLMVFDPK